MTNTEDKRESCGLCGAEDVLEVSHLVPRFVAKRMRKDSPTNFFRDGRNVNVRVQDAPKERLLCRSCENRFSELESRFAQDIFTPTMDGVALDLELTAQHHRFCASIAWRNLKRVLLRRDQLNSDYSENDWRGIEQAEHDLREYLLGRARPPADIQLHLFNARSMTEAQIPGINAFLNLSMGLMLHSREEVPNRLYSTSPMNGLIIIGLIRSDERCRNEWDADHTMVLAGRHWRNHDQEINDAYFGGILLHLAAEQSKAFDAMSEKQKRVTAKAMERTDLKKWASSQHGKAVIQDLINRMRRKK